MYIHYIGSIYRYIGKVGVPLSPLQVNHLTFERRICGTKKEEKTGQKNI